MINPRIARYMLAKHGRAGLPGLVHDNLADLGVTPRALDVEEEGEGVAPTAIAEADQGQLDVPPQAAMEGAQPEELDAFPQPFSAPPTVEAQAPVVASRAAAESDDEDETADARQRDRTSAIARGFETAGRQFVAGLTRTPILDTLTQQTNNVGDVRASQKSRAERLRMAAEAARQSRETDDKLMNSESSRILNLARAAALSRDIRTGQDPSIASRGLDLQAQRLADEKAKTEENQKLAREKFEASQKPKGPKAPKLVSGVPEGWETNPASPPTEKSKNDFAKLVYDDDNIRRITAKMRRLLAAAGTRERLDPSENEEIKQTAKMLDVAVKEVPKLGALSGPDMAIVEAISVDPTRVGSLIKDQGRLLNGIDEWLGMSVAAGEKAYGFRKRAPKAGPVVKGKSGKSFRQNANGEWEEVD